MICQHCGISFMPSKILPHREYKFCSTDCYHSHSRKGTWIHSTCKHCGKPFSRYVTPGRDNHHTDEYCSQTCHNRHRRTKPDGFYSRIPTRKVGYLKPIPCPACGKMFKPKQSIVKFCSRTCARTMRSDKGRMRTPQTIIDEIKRSYASKTAKEIGAMFSKSEAAIHFIARKIGMHLTREQVLEKSKQTGLKRRGKNNTLWLGGTKNLPWGKDWNQKRIATRKRDNYTCQVCGKSALTVHHITPRRFFVIDIDKANELTNLITLCAHCHRLVETGKIECPRPT